MTRWPVEDVRKNRSSTLMLVAELEEPEDSFRIETEDNLKNSFPPPQKPHRSQKTLQIICGNEGTKLTHETLFELSRSKVRLIPQAHRLVNAFERRR